jgi:hypothetical protein
MLKATVIIPDQPKEIQAAQKLMAQIAVKILTQKRQKTHEQ